MRAHASRPCTAEAYTVSEKSAPCGKPFALFAREKSERRAREEREKSERRAREEREKNERRTRDGRLSSPEKILLKTKDRSR